MMIASDTGQSKSKVTPISILSIQLHSNFRAQIVYGQTPFLAFETIVSILHFSSYCKATDLKNCLWKLKLVQIVTLSSTIYCQLFTIAFLETI